VFITVLRLQDIPFLMMNLIMFVTISA